MSIRKKKTRPIAPKGVIIGLVATLVILLGSPGHALNIILNDTTGMSADEAAAFESAAAAWEALFFDDITVRLDVGTSDMGANILGSALSYGVELSYTDVRNALITDQLSADDATAVASLEAASTFSFVTNNPLPRGPADPFTSYAFDGTNYWIEENLWVTRANAKAIDLQVDDGAADAEISFNSLFGWDYDSSDGISAGLYDFTGVAMHEIGHALGFISGVDIIDLVSCPSGPYCGTREAILQGWSVFSILDLYRYSDASVADGVGRDLAVGYDPAPYFSLDGGLTDLGLFSTGRYNGDGRQASHWKDHLGLGILDPTFASGEFGVISGLDILAFDVIGYDLARVPEPGTVILLGTGLFGLIGFGWRRNRLKG